MRTLVLLRGLVGERWVGRGGERGCSARRGWWV